jgi:CRP-like cAMP-binding protein
MQKDKKCLIGRYGQKADYTGKFCSRMCEGTTQSEFDIQVVDDFMSYFNESLVVNDNIRSGISPMLWVRKFGKKERIVMPGEICTTSFWLQSGYGRCFVITNDKEGLPFEKTIKFFGQGKIAAIHSSFFNEEPCDFYFELSAGAVVVPFSRSCFETLKLNVPEIGDLANNIMAREETEHLEKMELIGLKARERYQEFLKIFGVEIEQHFAIKHIASYLKIPPSFLSKIRSELYRK